MAHCLGRSDAVTTPKGDQRCYVSYVPNAGTLITLFFSDPVFIRDLLPLVTYYRGIWVVGL